MRHLLFSSMLAGLAFAPAAFAQAPGYTTPKTAWGAPDLTGYWTNESLTRMTRPPEATKLVVTEAEEQEILQHNTHTKVLADEARVSDVSEEASEKLLADKNPNRGYNRFWMTPGERFGRVKGEIRTSWIVDPPNGRMPFKPQPKALGFGSHGFGGNDFTSYETRPYGERCIHGFLNGAGPVLSNGLYNNIFQIVQTPTHVMILGEMIHEARIAPIVKSKADVKHDPVVLQEWSGDGVAWYEGDTLVVETTNLNSKQNYYASETGKVTERFTRWNDGEIFYEFTVEDPSVYTQPWRGEQSLKASDKPIYEYACHEGNESLLGILRGGRQFEALGKPQPSISTPTFGELGEE